MAKSENKYCTLYLVRHGETEWNAKGLAQGQADIPLNENGIKQASILKDALKDISFDAIFSSDLVRAKKTAEIIAFERELAVQTTKLIRERRWGKMDGSDYMTTKQFQDTWSSLSKKDRLTYKPFKDYETDQELISRSLTFLREISILYPCKTLLVVTHGGIIRSFLNHVTDDTYGPGAISNSGYIKLESNGVDFFIRETKGVTSNSKK